MTKKILFFSFLFVTNIFSYPAGALDPSFSGDGIALITVEQAAQSFALAIQPDQKIVPVGVGFSGSRTDIAVVRLLTDGSLDTTFGTSGIVTTSAIPGRNSLARDVKLDSNLRIIVAGQTLTASSGTDIAVVRFNPDGSLDTTFGNNGKVTTAISAGTGTDIANGVVIQPDNKIIAIGQAGSAVPTVALVRYNENGSLDSSFGTGGKVSTTLGFTNATALDGVLQPDGKIVVVGQANTSAIIFIARFNADGSLDTTFGTGGVTSRDVNAATENLDAVTLQADGKIVAVGRASFGAQQRLLVIRLNPDGSFDSTFGTNGIVTFAPTGISLQGIGVQIQRDSRIVAGAIAQGSGPSRFGVVRFNTDGSLDTTFGDNGIVTVVIGLTASPSDLELQRNGRIVLTGFAALTGGAQPFALIRCLVCPDPAVQGSLASAISAKFS